MEAADSRPVLREYVHTCPRLRGCSLRSTPIPPAEAQSPPPLLPPPGAPAPSPMTAFLLPTRARTPVQAPAPAPALPQEAVGLAECRLPSCRRSGPNLAVLLLAWARRPRFYGGAAL
jgi:hypothetical protein